MTDGFSLDDRCIQDYRIGHKSRKYSIGMVTFVEKPRAVECIVKSSLSRAKFVTECCDFQKLQPLLVRHFTLNGFCPRMNL